MDASPRACAAARAAAGAGPARGVGSGVAAFRMAVLAGARHASGAAHLQAGDSVELGRGAALRQQLRPLVQLPAPVGVGVRRGPGRLARRRPRQLRGWRRARAAQRRRAERKHVPRDGTARCTARVAAGAIFATGRVSMADGAVAPGRSSACQCSAAWRRRTFRGSLTLRGPGRGRQRASGARLACGVARAPPPPPRGTAQMLGSADGAAATVSGPPLRRAAGCTTPRAVTPRAELRCRRGRRAGACYSHRHIAATWNPPHSSRAAPVRAALRTCIVLVRPRHLDLHEAVTLGVQIATMRMACFATMRMACCARARIALREPRLVSASASPECCGVPPGGGGLARRLRFALRALLASLPQVPALVHALHVQDGRSTPAGDPSLHPASAHSTP
jgi:hypothetical protein